MKRWDYNEGSFILGDCLEVMKGFPDDHVDLIVGSPPYEQARLYLENGEDLGIARNTNEWVKWLVEVFKECVRICKGVVALVVGHGTGNRHWTGAPALLTADLIRAGVNLRSPLWYKRNGSPGAGGNDWFRPDLEWVICATKCDELPWHDNTSCGHPPKYGKGGAMSRRQKDGTRVKGSVVELRSFELANPGNVIDCGAVGGNHLGSSIAHDSEAPFPEKVPLLFIRSCCPKEGIVCDPFGGSGTTMSCAVQNGRRFLMMDIRPSQIEIMKRRLREARCKVGFGF